jgi:hypothetical protein
MRTQKKKKYLVCNKTSVLYLLQIVENFIGGTYRFINFHNTYYYVNGRSNCD